jgi:hypothetical protein
MMARHRTSVTNVIAIDSGKVSPSARRQMNNFGPLQEIPDLMGHMGHQIESRSRGVWCRQSKRLRSNPLSGQIMERYRRDWSSRIPPPQLGSAKAPPSATPSLIVIPDSATGPPRTTNTRLGVSAANLEFVRAWALNIQVLADSERSARERDRSLDAEGNGVAPGGVGDGLAQRARATVIEVWKRSTNRTHHGPQQFTAY